MTGETGKYLQIIHLKVEAEAQSLQKLLLTIRIKRGFKMSRKLSLKPDKNAVLRYSQWS